VLHGIKRYGTHGKQRRVADGILLASECPSYRIT
jgi:hypothetical protein